MDKAALDRLRRLAGTEAKTELPKDESRRNMYQIRDLMEGAEDRARYDAAQGTDKKVTLKKAPWEKDEVKEAEKPDFADIDGDGDKKETAKKAAKDKKEMTEADQMREWANSIYKQYDDRGHYQEQPDGETVDLSLRRYLNAKAMPVKIEEDHTVKGMLKEYKTFKEKADNPYAIGMSQAMKSTGDKPPLKKSTIKKAHKIAKKVDEGYAAYDKDNKVVGNYKDLATAKKMKPGHTYKKSKGKTDDKKK